MMRLIDADKLINRIEKWIPKDPCGEEAEKALKDKMDFHI